MRGRAWVKLTQRAALVVLSQVLAVAAVFAVVNQQNSFYLTWTELVGAANPGVVTIQTGAESPAATAPASPSSAASPTTTTTSAVGGANAFTADGTGLLVADVTGSHSGVHGQILVWTPPGYTGSGAALPVVLALAGYPGNPVDTFNGLRLRTILPDLIASGKLPPMIVVSATTDIDGKDWGCSDAPGGPSVATWLSVDVQSTVRAHFNVDAHSRWNLLGLSAGATCAVRLALTHFDQFEAAASIAGYNTPDAPVLTGDPAATRANNLMTLAAAGTPRPVSLLLAASKQDPGTLGDALALQRSVGPGVQADVETVARGGHNWEVWAAMTPPALTWLGQHFSP